MSTISSNSQTNWWIEPDYFDASWLIPYAASGNPAVAVNIGDLCYDAGSGVAYPAGQQASTGAEGSDQILFAKNFIGCATEGCLSTETNTNRRLNIRTRGMKAFTCPSQTWTVGALVGIYSTGSAVPDATQVDAAVTMLGAIGIVVPAPANPAYYNSAVTTVYVYYEAAHCGDYEATRANLGFEGAFQLGASANDNVTNTNAETAFVTTALIPAGYLTAGDVLHVKALAVVNAQNSTNTNRVRVEITTAANTYTTVFDTGAVNAAANAVALLEGDLFFTAVGNTGNVYAIGDQGFGAVNTATRALQLLTNTTINTSLNVTIRVTDLQSAASTGNVTQLYSLEVTKKRK